MKHLGKRSSSMPSLMETQNSAKNSLAEGLQIDYSVVITNIVKPSLVNICMPFVSVYIILVFNKFNVQLSSATIQDKKGLKLQLEQYSSIRVLANLDTNVPKYFTVQVSWTLKTQNFQKRSRSIKDWFLKVAMEIIMAGSLISQIFKI